MTSYSRNYRLCHDRASLLIMPQHFKYATSQEITACSIVLRAGMNPLHIVGIDGNPRRSFPP
jgi:hypothetical protein